MDNPAAELAELRLQLAEALETLDAIRNGEVDAVVVGGPDNRQVYTLETADRSYRLLIEQMTEGAIMLSADNAVLYANQALADMLHTSTGRLIGSSFAPMVAPEDAGKYAELLAAGGKAELVLQRADAGGPFIAQVSLTPMATGDGAFLCGVVTDLTATYAQAREVAEAKSSLAVDAARRESDERYRLILEGATDYAIMAIDLDEKVTIWNAGAHAILGWSDVELNGEAIPMIWTDADLADGVAAEEKRICLETGRCEHERWHLRKDGSCFWAHSLMMPLRNDRYDLIGFLKILRDRTEQRSADERQSLLINELNHRVKNTLATVQSIATQTFRRAPSPEEGLASLEDRLMALSRAHDVLTRESWEGAELGQIVDLAVAPYLAGEERRITTGGPPVRLSPHVALAIAMALQELATNAAKYGALSVGEGHLAVRWKMHKGALELTWRESDGPVVTPPERRGFGSRLIERSLAGEAGGAVSLDFAPTGVVCIIRVTFDAPIIQPAEPSTAGRLHALA